MIEASPKEYQQIISDILDYMNSKEYLEMIYDNFDKSSFGDNPQDKVDKYNKRVKNYNLLTDKILKESNHKLDENTYWLLGALIDNHYKEYIDHHAQPLPEERQYQRTTDPYILGLSKRI